MRKNIVFKVLILLLGIANISLAQEAFDVPPQPFEGESDIKKTKDAIIEEIKTKSPNLIKNPISGLEFNWSDADLWVFQQREDSQSGTKSTLNYMNGLGQFNSDSLNGELDIKIGNDLQKAFIKVQVSMIEGTMIAKFPGSNFSVIFNNSFENEARIIFKVERIGVGDDYFKSLIGQSVEIKGKLLFMFYSINRENIPEHIENMWVKRLKNVKLR
jgi:hypothetical protein